MLVNFPKTLSTYRLMRVTRGEFEGRKKISSIDKIPLVYIQIDQKNLYVGKSTDIYSRFTAHLKDKSKTFTEVIVITSDQFNESSIKHIETLLIDYFFGDGKFNVLNSMTGQNIHRYFGLEDTNTMFKDIWSDLIDEKIANLPLQQIHNKFLYKYSPTTNLSYMQQKVSNNILNAILTKSESRHMINGDPGTGKTLVLIAIINGLLIDPITKAAREGLDREDVALIIPQNHSLASYKELIRKIGLHGISVLSPAQFIRDAKQKGGKFKYVFVDEAHRLKQYFRKQARDLKHLLTPNGTTTELELIAHHAYHLTVVYDQYQTIRPADIDTNKFKSLTKDFDNHYLNKQFRVKSGDQYLKWLRKLLQIENNSVVYGEDLLKGYDFKVFDSISELHDAIKDHNNKYDLCRVVAGYSWKWETKKDKSLQDIVDPETNKKFNWNSKIKGWIYQEDSIDEIGCIHTTQGADLNYVGVILGQEIDCNYAGEEDGSYDLGKAKIIIHPEKYKDRNGLPIKNTDPNNDELSSYIKRIYYILMSRGINGCYVYACNTNMQRYIREVSSKII